jgi:hypothetical protein
VLLEKLTMLQTLDFRCLETFTTMMAELMPPLPPPSPPPQQPNNAGTRQDRLSGFWLWDMDRQLVGKMQRIARGLLGTMPLPCLPLDGDYLYLSSSC